MKNENVFLDNSTVLTEKISSETMQAKLYSPAVYRQGSITSLYSTCKKVNNVSFYLYSDLVLSDFQKTDKINVVRNISLTSDSELDYMLIRQTDNRRKVFLDFKFLPKIFVCSISELKFSQKMAVFPKSDITLYRKTKITSDNERTFVFNNIIAEDRGSIIDSNLDFVCQILNLSTTSNEPFVNVSTRILSIGSDCLSEISEVKGVEQIDIHYSLQKTGYLRIHKMETKTKDLKVNLYNDDENDQFFYDRDWEDFQINLVCFSDFDFKSTNVSF